MLFILFTCCARKSLSNFNALSGSENYGAVKYGESFIFIARVVKGYVYAIVSQVQGCEGLRFWTPFHQIVNFSKSFWFIMTFS